MARIRSVHPGLWTDEAFVCCSPLARLLYIGLWTEADDQGVFEWKSVTLKMRLFPVDNVNIDALMAELAAHNMVRKYEHDGRQFGAIRNFRKYQRPKKPNCRYFLPPEWRTYVGLKDDSSEPVPHQDHNEEEAVPQKGEIALQMEDGGGRREEEGGRKKKNNSPPRQERSTPRQELQRVLDDERALAVLDHRQRIRKPLTPHAAKLLACEFAKCRDPNAAADTMIARGWQGFNPDWLQQSGQSPPASREQEMRRLEKL